MWIPKLLASGRWICENHNLDTTDQSWDTEADAAKWAAETNTRFAAETSARKAKSAERNAKRASQQASAPSDILTSHGDGWEGNGR